MAHKWVQMTPDSSIPPLAVVGEPDIDGFPTYVGRASHAGGTFPARVVSKEHCAYVSWGGSQIKKTDYEILVGENYSFVKCTADWIPLSAVRAGNTADGEPLWVGRGILDGKKLVGKIHPIHQCLFIAFGEEEHLLESYEVLVRSASESCPCESSNLDKVLANSIVSDAKNEVLEAQQASTLDISKLNNHSPHAVVEDANADVNNNVLGCEVSQSTTVVSSKVDKVPSNLVVADDPKNEVLETPQSSTSDTVPPSIAVVSADGKTNISAAEPPQSHTWIRWKLNKIPPKAVVAGYDANVERSIIYVGRANHEGEILPAKVIPDRNIVYVSRDGVDIRILNDFDVLVGDGYSWVKGSHSGDNIPIGAVTTGQTRDGKKVYVGRATYGDSLTPGKVHPGEYCVYIPFFGKEHKISDSYEILVRNEPSTADTWVGSSWGKAPPNAVVAGKDSDGSTIYVGRAYHEGETLPAKVIPDKRRVYITRNDNDYFKNEFEVLSGDGYTWVDGAHSGDNIPIGAVSTGETLDGKKVYVGRGHFGDSLTPGAVYPGDYCVYISYNFSVKKITNYQILVKN